MSLVKCEYCKKAIHPARKQTHYKYCLQYRRQKKAGKLPEVEMADITWPTIPGIEKVKRPRRSRNRSRRSTINKK